ncbi:MAG: beta-ketoacyl-[acyl-carrier-protein] synthase family protein [Clostridiales bacterium]|jgi:3-oxoacyl-[acyl-carrier-protein] synthase II|nr:beta-ketoacyl-[acyl-carrier-protein] synthase family protein [Clostridiales bacterium]
MNGVAITGMGVISSAGTNLEDFWKILESGTITYKEIKEYIDDKNYRTKIGARIEDEIWQCIIPNEYKLRYGRAAQYCISAAASAIENADINLKELSRLRVGVVISTTMGEIQVEERLSVIKQSEGPDKIPQELFTQYRTDNIVSALTNAFNLSGPVYMVPAACAGGNFAVGLGKRLLEWDEADIVIAGGVDVFSRVAFTGFQRLLSLAPDMCRPFDKDRKGLVLGEGCGIVIMEKTSFAKSRRAGILGELIGVGLTSDRFHMTAPHPQGDGAVRAMNDAIKESGISPEEINYVSAHGTGTPSNDKIEVKALETIFGEGKVPLLSSIKSMIGHPMGAAGAIELIASLQMMEKNTIVPTVNYSTSDPECNIDCVPNSSRKANIDCFLSNSFGFGGQSSSIIVKRG